MTTDKFSTVLQSKFFVNFQIKLTLKLVSNNTRLIQHNFIEYTVCTQKNTAFIEIYVY